MQVRELEELAARLNQLRDRLRQQAGSRSEPLRENDPLVQAALSCEFMLPEPCTVHTLADTVERKLDNVALLLERARKHEALPEIARAAAEQEYTMSEADRQHEQRQTDQRRTDSR